MTKAFVPLNREERRAIKQKSIPVLGAGVIEPERLPVVPQVLADMDLRIRASAFGFLTNDPSGGSMYARTIVPSPPL